MFTFCRIRQNSKHAINESIDNDYDAPELASMRRGAMVDGVLHFVAYGTALSIAILAPNIVQALDGPMAKPPYNYGPASSQTRDIEDGLLRGNLRGYLAGDYEHGLQLTGKAKRQLARERGVICGYTRAMGQALACNCV